MEKKQKEVVRQQLYRKKLKEQGVDPYATEKRNKLIKRIESGTKSNISSIIKYNINNMVVDTTKPEINSKIIDVLDPKPKPIKFKFKKELTLEDSISSLKTLKGEDQSDVTIINYISKFSKTLGLLEGDFSKFKTPNLVFEILSENYGIYSKDYIVSIIMTIKAYTDFKNTLTEEIISEYYTAMYKAKIQIQNNMIDNTEQKTIFQWNSLIELRNELEIENVYSMKYLLICLYTYLPPLRDNYGKIEVIDDYKGKVEIHKDNYYDRNNGIFIINEFKTSRNNTQQIMFIVPTLLKEIITNSLDHSPRKYLITKNNYIDCYAKGKLSSTINSWFKFSINSLRHCFETYFIKNSGYFSVRETNVINKIIGHNRGTGILYKRCIIDHNVENDEDEENSIKEDIVIEYAPVDMAEIKDIPNSNPEDLYINSDVINIEFMNILSGKIYNLFKRE